MTTTTGKERQDLLLRSIPPSQVFEAAPDAKIVVDATGFICYFNGEAESLFGYPRDELLGEPIETLLPSARRIAHLAHRNGYIANPHTRPMGKALNIIARRRDGTEFPADIKLSPLRTDAGIYVTAVVRDITERIRIEEQLRTYARNLERLKAQVERKNIELEQQNHELEQFAYVSSHDLQEPLRKIVAFGDRLKTRSESSLDPQGLDYLTRIQNAATRMQRLINDLLAFSRLSTKGNPFQRVDLAKIAAGVVSDLEVAVERTHGHIDVGELGAIDADASQIRQLMQNLISNALKFHREGVPPVVKIWGRPREDLYEIHVEDNGIGIEPRFRERIFTVFERLHPRTEYEGTGIGLAICKKIAERHRGNIAVQSNPGAGTTFIVTLPREHEEH